MLTFFFLASDEDYSDKVRMSSEQQKSADLRCAVGSRLSNMRGRSVKSWQPAESGKSLSLNVLAACRIIAQALGHLFEVRR